MHMVNRWDQMPLDEAVQRGHTSVVTWLSNVPVNGMSVSDGDDRHGGPEGFDSGGDV